MAKLNRKASPSDARYKASHTAPTKRSGWERANRKHILMDDSQQALSNLQRKTANYIADRNDTHTSVHNGSKTNPLQIRVAKKNLPTDMLEARRERQEQRRKARKAKNTNRGG